MEFLPLLMFIAMFATLAVLVVGVIMMARGGKINHKYSNKLMTMRVVLQAVAIAVVALIFFVTKKP